MAAPAPSSDQATDLLQKLSLDTNPKTLEIPEPIKKTSANQFGSVEAANGQNQSYDRSLTPLSPNFIDPALCYLPNAYPSAAYYFGGAGGEWDEYSGYANAEGLDINSGFFGDNGSFMYHHGYGYTPYGPYSPATSPVPGNDQLYGTQHYHYPSPYFQSLTPTSAPFSPSPVAQPRGKVPSSALAEQKHLPVETVNGNSNGTTNAVKGNSRSAHSKSSNQNSSYNSKGSLPGAMASGYQGPRFGYDGLCSPIPWLDAAVFSDGRAGPVASPTISNSFPNPANSSSRNQQFHCNSDFTGFHHSRPMSGMGTANGFGNSMYHNKYGHYGSSVHSGMGFGAHGFDSRSNSRGWLTVDKYKSRGLGNGNYGYFSENVDGLNELNRGPRAKSTKNQKSLTPILAIKGQNFSPNGAVEEEKSRACVIPDQDQYNKVDFPEDFTDAKFFIIKSYSEDDVHKSLKYNVWASTPNGNKKLDAAFREAQEKSSGCPIFLFFSVNTSGQFVGLAEMLGPVDFQKSVEYWQQDKWNGCFPVKWHIVKDVPNSLLKHITLENNENKPVTNSRDTQEVKLAHGLKMIKIFKGHSVKTCLLDDFEFYENRQKVIQEKKAKQLQFQKQVWEGKATSDKKESMDGELNPQKPLDVSDVVKESLTDLANGDVKDLDDGTAVKMVDGP